MTTLPGRDGRPEWVVKRTSIKAWTSVARGSTVDGGSAARWKETGEGGRRVRGEWSAGRAAGDRQRLLVPDGGGRAPGRCPRGGGRGRRAAAGRGCAGEFREFTGADDPGDG